jgi:hemoglobin
MTQQYTDISSRADIERLVNHFYGQIRQDALLGPIFDDVARVDWERHLPKMYAFWEKVLFGVPGFQGNPLAVHLALAARTPLGAREFDRWLGLFRASVQALFRGPVADEAMERAARIAGVMQYHIAGAASARA